MDHPGISVARQSGSVSNCRQIMPLTTFQSETLRLLAAHRSPESYLALGTVLNAGADSPRYSQDLDIFQDVEGSVLTSAETDTATLRQAGWWNG